MTHESPFVPFENPTHDVVGEQHTNFSPVSMDESRNLFDKYRKGISMVAVTAVLSLGGGAVISEGSVASAAEQTSVQTSGHGSTNSSSGETSTQQETPKIAAKQAKAAIKLWNDAVNTVWVGDPSSGINYPSENNQLFPDRKQFSETVNADWIARYGSIRNHQEIPEFKTTVELLTNVKLFFTAGKQVIEVENPIINGIGTDETNTRGYNNFADNANPSYDNYAITFAMPNGEWVTTTLQQNGVGWQTQDNLRFVGLLKDPTQSPTIVRSKVNTSMPMTDTSLTVTTETGQNVPIGLSQSYKGLKTGVANEIAKSGDVAVSLWTLPGGIVKQMRPPQ